MNLFNSKKFDRNSALEILRIIAMLMVFLHHAIIHGGTSFWASNDLQDFFREGFFHLGKIGVIIYVIISGYFLSASKFSYRKLFKFIVEIYLFVFIGLIITIVRDKPLLDWEFFKPYIFIFSSNQYWFASQYLLLFISAPLLKLGLDKMSRNAHLAIIGMLFIFCSIMPSVFKLFAYTYYFLHFILFFFIGAYLRRHPLPDLKWGKWLVIIFAIALFSIMTLIVVKTAFDPVKKDWANRLYQNDNSPLAILIALCMVIFFTQLKPFKSKIINFLSLGVFEIYLFHDNIAIRPKIWHLGIDTATLPHSKNWWIQFLGANLLKFLIVMAIAIAIKVIYDLTVCKLIDIISDKINQKIEKRNLSHQEK